LSLQFHPALLPGHHPLTSTAAPPFATPAGAAAAVPALAQPPPSLTAASPLIASPAGSLKPGSETMIAAAAVGTDEMLQATGANCTLFVANIGQSCTEQDLRDVFGTCVQSPPP